MKQYILSGSIFALGIIAGTIFSNFSIEDYGQSKIATLRKGEFEFINPLLDCEISDGLVAVELLPIKKRITDLTDTLKRTHKASHISVYFRDLNNGPWFGINEKELFSPASLLKVPIMIAALKQSETDPNFLNQILVHRDTLDTRNQHYQPKEKLEIGNAYTVDELIGRMIIYSDNEALHLILSKMEEEILNQVYAQVGVIAPTIERTEDFMNVRNYASFFRILYNASYLNENSSNKALGILSEVRFSGGLGGGVPHNIQIAHKFGEREYLGHQQLHDCGIIYFPNHPYILCVMNRGDDLDMLAENISEISKAVYEEVNKQSR
ncbi:MAG: beta-lactamase [Parcubacteria group bacterium Gr01-1014_19]|nr:MAG: beta-lactamase [Parcubacteria group bacterium Gr01-1014_19]